jgi:hypothetical protein
MAKTKTVETIEVEPIRIGTISLWLRGRTPIILNRMSEKARQQLLIGGTKKTKAEKEQSMKHDPIEEFRRSMHIRRDATRTRLGVPSPAIKGAMCTAALETKGTTKAQTGRLVWVRGYDCELFGVPKLHMSVVRSADMNRTPDVRTRAIVEDWCMPVTIEFARPQMSDKAVVQLLANAGVIIGIGDYRNEKGKGTFGQFEIVTEADCKDIIASGGKGQQDEAIDSPECYDDDAREMLSWFLATVKQRGKTGMLASHRD